jgi:hypothetical protein
MSRFALTFAAPLLALALVGCTPAATDAPTRTASPSPTPPAGLIDVTGFAHAGPTCPVEKVPPDPACADRPVAGAVLVVTTAAGAEVARALSAADGTFRVAVPPGDYVLVPRPVAGLLGTAQPVPFRAVADGAAPAPLDVAYDTGIR